MWQYVDKLSIAPFAQSFIVFWRNMTALPPGIEEAAFIFHVSRGNWSASFSAPILQHFATIDNLSVGHAYEIQLAVGPRWFGDMSSALRPIGMKTVRTRSERKSYLLLNQLENIDFSRRLLVRSVCTAQWYVCG